MTPSTFDFLGLRLPLFCAPTGSIAGPELASAVSQAGAMGAMALTWTDPQTARRHVRAVRAATANPFQVNFALAFAPDSLNAALEEGVPCVTFSWGDPDPYLSSVRAAGAKVGIQVSTPLGARRALDLGADFLICQGLEAGGHVQSTIPLEDVLPMVLAEAGPAPVVAAGGVGDGAGMARLLALGAGGVMLGTRFVATRESRAHPDYKQKLCDSQAADTALTVCFDGDWPYAAHRVLRTPPLETWEAHGCPPHAQRPGDGDIMGHTQGGEPILRYSSAAPRAGTTGRILDMCLYAGAGCGAIADIPSACDLVSKLWTDCTQAMKG